MKKIVTREYEATVCDYCGKEADPRIRKHIEVCKMCRKDVCSDCSIKIILPESKVTKPQTICKTHVPLGFFEGLENE